MAREFAPLLSETVTEVEPPARSVPPEALRLTQSAVLPALQTKTSWPVLVRLYSIETGLKGPPALPEEIRSSGGVTTSTPGVSRLMLTVKLPRTASGLMFPRVSSTAPS